MRVFKNKPFLRFAKKAGIKNSTLCKAILNAERGLIDADLGGGLIKQRVARDGEGKSGGFRTIIIFKSGTMAFFVHGFAKNERDNIDVDDLAMLKRLASEMLSYTDEALRQAVNKGILVEVFCDEEVS